MGQGRKASQGDRGGGRASYFLSPSIPPPTLLLVFPFVHCLLGKQTSCIPDVLFILPLDVVDSWHLHVCENPGNGHTFMRA